MTKKELGGWMYGFHGFSQDFHGSWRQKIRKNPVKIREIRTSIHPTPFLSCTKRKILKRKLREKL
jgi:hypothetical protein